MNAEVFVCYSRHDVEFKKEIMEHLAALSSFQNIDVWSDEKISVGEDWKAEIIGRLEKCDIAIVLLSRNSMSNKFILDNELASFFEKSLNSNSFKIFPVLVKPVFIPEDHWIAKRQIYKPNDDAFSLLKEEERDHWYALLCEKIHNEIRVRSLPEKNAKSAINMGEPNEKNCNERLAFLSTFGAQPWGAETFDLVVQLYCGDVTTVSGSPGANIELNYGLREAELLVATDSCEIIRGTELGIVDQSEEKSTRSRVEFRGGGRWVVHETDESEILLNRIIGSDALCRMEIRYDARISAIHTELSISQGSINIDWERSKLEGQPVPTELRLDTNKNIILKLITTSDMPTNKDGRLVISSSDFSVIVDDEK